MTVKREAINGLGWLVKRGKVFSISFDCCNQTPGLNSVEGIERRHSPRCIGHELTEKKGYRDYFEDDSRFGFVVIE
jgi:hypothetical protein